MPRVSREVSDRRREQIEQNAARLFRERGIQGVNVAELMAAVGLTHGSFYSHFDSKEALARTAIEGIFARSEADWSARILDATVPGDAIIGIVEGYLSDANVANPGGSCAATAFSIDVGREDLDSPVRPVFAEGLDKLLGELATGLGGGAEGRRRAVPLLAAMVGGLALARATAGTPMAKEIQTGVADHLRNSILGVPRS